MTYQRVVGSLTDYIVDEMKLSAKEKGRIRYGIEIVFSSLISLGFSLGLALVLGTLTPVIFILVSGAILKLLAGGIHMKTIWECALYTSLITNMLGIMSLYYTPFLEQYKVWFLLVAFLYIYIALWLWSPAEVPQKPIPGERRKKLKGFSLLVVTLALLLSLVYIYTGISMTPIVALVFGLLFQALAINPFAYKLFNTYYSIKEQFVR